MTFSALDSDILGPLFATAEMRACFSDDALLAAMVQAEAALATAQAGRGLAPAGLAAAVETAGVGLADPGTRAALGSATAIAGVPTIPFLKLVQSRLPAPLEPAFHRGATTQDVLDTALVLRLRPAMALLQAELDGTVGGLMRLAAAHRRTPCVGRTYGQHAAPLTFGFKVAVWLTGIAEVLDALPALRARLLVASLGGPVGNLAAMGADGPAVLDAFAAELGLGVTPLCWHTLRGRVAEAGAWLAQLIGALAKMATDVAHLASTEVGEVSEPYVPGRGGSSAMPHKRNPVSSTVILAAHAAAPGAAATLVACMAAAHERPAGAWHAEWHALPQLFGLASGALREARALAEGLVVDTGCMEANLELTRGLLFADAAALCLAPALGKAQAHGAVERAAGEVRASGASLRDVLGDSFPEHRDVLAPAFDITRAVAACDVWITRALADAERVRRGCAAPDTA